MAEFSVGVWRAGNTIVIEAHDPKHEREATLVLDADDSEWVQRRINELLPQLSDPAESYLMAGPLEG